MDWLWGFVFCMAGPATPLDPRDECRFYDVAGVTLAHRPVADGFVDLRDFAELSNEISGRFHEKPS
jgi:hypothetical protein